MFETIINGLGGVKNGGIGTKMSILALLVLEIWRFCPFWVGLGAILALLAPQKGKFGKKNFVVLQYHCQYIHQCGKLV